MRNFSEGVGKIFSRVKLKNFLQWRFVKRATNRVIEQLNVAISHHFTPRRLVLKPYFYHILIKFHWLIHRFWEKRVTNNIDQRPFSIQWKMKPLKCKLRDYLAHSSQILTPSLKILSVLSGTQSLFYFNTSFNSSST